jgi:hypothetical protein
MVQAGYPIYPRVGVLNRDGDPDFGEPIKRAYSDNDSVTIEYSDGDVEEFDATNITLDPNTGRLIFESEGDTYRVRELAEDDGEWLSKYRTMLPINAVESLAGGNVDDDTLDAYASEDSPYVLGLVYTNEAGRFLREDGDWVALSPNDETFNDMIVTSIDPERAQEFIDLYDRNYVSVADAEQYELDGATVDEE